MKITLKEKLESMGKPYYNWRTQKDNERLYANPISYNEKSAFELAKTQANLYKNDGFYSDFSINPVTGDTFLIPLPKEDWYFTQH